MSTSLKQLFQTTRTVITETGWTQGAFARDANGRPNGINHVTGERCACYCLSGAVDRATNILFGEDGGWNITHAADTFLTELVQQKFSPELRSYIEWNDQKGRTVKEVLDLLDDAVEKAPSAPIESDLV
jgi:hypothetical protein